MTTQEENPEGAILLGICTGAVAAPQEVAWQNEWEKASVGEIGVAKPTRETCSQRKDCLALKEREGTGWWGISTSRAGEWSQQPRIKGPRGLTRVRNPDGQSSSDTMSNHWTVL